VHSLLELLLVEELEDEEDELAAERRHGVGGGGGGRSPPGARSARPGARLAEGAALVAGPPGRPRILGFRRRPPSSPLASEAGTIEKRRCGRGVGERERNFSLAFFDALQTSRPFLSPHATHHLLICEKQALLLISGVPIDKLIGLYDRPRAAESKGPGLNRVDIRELASGREGDVRARRDG